MVSIVNIVNIVNIPKLQNPKSCFIRNTEIKTKVAAFIGNAKKRNEQCIKYKPTVN